jgi:hypothetical protein
LNTINKAIETQQVLNEEMDNEIALWKLQKTGKLKNQNKKIM